MATNRIQDRAPDVLTPPIPKASPLKTSLSTSRTSASIHPAITFKGDKSIRPNKEPGTYLALDLRTPGLNDIHQYLWLAGLPNAARPLHRQKFLGRSILITEDPDEHLVWFESQIFIKPMPVFLFDHDYWSKNLCTDKESHKSACGLLLSYAWLVRHKSDLEIAKESGLLPRNMEWEDWVEFLEGFLENINLNTLSQVNQRYKYGELRLSRLNKICRFLLPSFSIKTFVRGYRSGSTWYSAFFERHFKWMIAVFAIFSVFLSALQVGLGTPMLQNEDAFQRLSFVFTWVAMILVLASVALVFLVWTGLFWYHLLSAWWNNRVVDFRRQKGVPSP